MDTIINDLVIPEPLQPLLRSWRGDRPVSDAEYIDAQVYLRRHPASHFMLPDYRATYGRRSGVDRDKLWPYVKQRLTGH